MMTCLYEVTYHQADAPDVVRLVLGPARRRASHIVPLEVADAFAACGRRHGYDAFSLIELEPATVGMLVDRLEPVRRPLYPERIECDPKPRPRNWL